MGYSVRGSEVSCDNASARSSLSVILILVPSEEEENRDKSDINGAIALGPRIGTTESGEECA